MITGGSRRGLSRRGCLVVVVVLEQGSVDDDEVSICWDNCLFSTFELFASTKGGDELRSTMKLSFTGGIDTDDDDVSITVVAVGMAGGSVEVFSPLVEQIADDGDRRF